MAGNNLELALRIKTDLDKARADVGAFTNDLQQAGVTTAAASDQAATALNELDAQIDRVGTSATTTATALGKEAAELHDTASAAGVADAALGAVATTEREVLTAAAAATTALSKEATELTDTAAAAGTADTKLDQLAEAQRRVAAETIAAARAAGFQATAVNASGKAINAQGNTVAQHTMAMRQLPMQITDITTSLVSGMPIYMIAVQQGGQLRDAFGGITPALKAMLSLLNPVYVALGLTAVAAGALAVAYRQGAAESQEFNKQLALTNNMAGLTTDQLADMAKRIDGVIGTSSQASAALAMIVAAGGITREQFELVAISALRMEEATGQSVDKTVENFSKLAADPTKYVLELNKGTNFLTASLYQQIVALQSQGRQAEAASLAIQAYAGYTEEAHRKILNGLDPLDSAWARLKKTVAEAWDAMAGNGRDQTVSDQIATINQRLAEVRKFGMPYDFTGENAKRFIAEQERQLQLLQQKKKAAEDAATAEGRSRQNDALATAAQTKINELLEKTKSGAQKASEALAELDRWLADAAKGGKDYTKEQVAAMQQLIREQNKTKATPDPHAAARASLARLAIENRAYQAEAAADINKQVAIRGEALRQQYADEIKLAAGSAQQRALIERRIAQEQEQFRKQLVAKRADVENAVLDQAVAKVNERYAEEKRVAEVQAQLQAQYLRATGKLAEANSADVELRFKALRDELTRLGDTEGLVKLQVIIDREKALADFQRLREELSRLSDERSTRRESARIDFDSGRSSQGQYREQLREIDEEINPKIRNIAGEARKAATAIGDPAAVANIERMVQALDQVDQSYTKFLPKADEINESLADGLTDALMKVADGTASVRDAFRQFAADFLRQIAEMILKQMIFNAISGGKGAGGTGGAGGAIAGGLSALLGLPGYSEGGWTGPGGKYDFAGFNHANEFVLRQEVVRQPGAISFLEQFNRVGMSALSGLRGYSGGGLVTPAVTAPRSPTSPIADPAAQIGANVSMENSQAFYLIDDPARIGDIMKGPMGREAQIIAISRDPAKFRSALGIKG